MALPSRLVRVLLPVAAVLEAISLVGTAWGYAVLRQHSRSGDLARFERLIVGAETTLALRLATYEQALWGGAGLFNASSEVTPGEWDAYVGSIRPQEHLPGLLGLGWIEAVPEADLPAYLERQRRWIAEFRHQVLPGTAAAPGDDHLIISYVVPRQINAPAFGLDLIADSDRRSTLEAAWASRQARITPVIDLVQDAGPDAGMFLAIPVDERADRHRHWIYAPLLGWQVFAGILPATGGEIAAVIVDEGPAERTIATLGGGEPEVADALHVERRISFAGRTWVGRWRSTGQFRSADRGQSILLLGLGLALSATLLVVLHQLARGMRRSNRLMEQAVLGRGVVEERLLGTLRAAGMALFTVSRGGRPSPLLGAVPPGVDRDWFADVAEVEASEILRVALALSGDDPPAPQALRLRLGPARRWYRCHLGRLSGSGEVIGVLVDVADLIRVQGDLGTSRQQAQRDLAHHRDAARARAEALAVISRTLGQHLDGLRACIAGLDRLGVDHQQRHLLQSISGSGSAIGRLLLEVQEIAEIEAGTLVVTAIPFPPERVIEAIDRRLGPRVRERGLALRLEAEDLPAILRGDARRIARIVDDLVRDALARGVVGSILIIFACESDGDAVVLRITVQDQQGQGTAPAPDRATLGPILAEDLCIHLGGNLTIQAGGAGTTATARLPLTRAEPGDADLLGGLGTADVLVLDDGSQDRPLVQILELSGAELTVVAAGDLDPNPRPSARALIAHDPLPESALCWTGARILFAASARTVDDRTTLLTDDQDLAAQVAALRRALTAAAATAIAPAAGPRVLLADDHVVNRRLVPLILGRRCTAVALAENGVDAIHQHRTDPFDLILMDCQMPVCDGLEATRRIRAAERVHGGPRAVIVGISGALGDEDRQRATEAGMDELLARPLSEEVLARLVADLPALRVHAGSPPIIGPAFARLRRSIDGPTFTDLVRTTRETLEERRQRIQAAATRGDHAAIAREAHSTKGAAAGMGLEALRQRSADLECLTRAAEDASAIEAAFHAWVKSLEDTLRHLPEP